MDSFAILSLMSNEVPHYNVTLGDSPLSRHLSQMGPAWAGFSKCLILENFVFFLSFLVLNAENQKGDTINLLDQREKRNHTL